MEFLKERLEIILSLKQSLSLGSIFEDKVGHCLLVQFAMYWIGWLVVKVNERDRRANNNRYRRLQRMHGQQDAREASWRFGFSIPSRKIQDLHGVSHESIRDPDPFGTKP